ncbi:hypothetical protein [Cereibacter sphaeroides]|uniref:hypothetical protein n=1 Tax=Cereibacter sphaeroides TaxID=1063 RepID=UPI00313C3555
MLDWLRGYFTAWSHAATTAEWSDATVQFLATLLAGAISFFVARETVAHQEAVSARKAAATEATTAGNAVTLAFFKIIECGEILAGMRNLLDEQFLAASAERYAIEPFQIIRPITGQDYPPRRVELSEIAFLSNSNSIDLISDIALVYRRTINCVHLSDVYSKSRVELHDWLQHLPGHRGSLKGDLASDEFPIDHEDGFNRRAANLNLIIASLVCQIDETIALVEDVVDRLGAASKLEFGMSFPVIKAQYPRILMRIDDIRRACIASETRFSF